MVNDDPVWELETWLDNRGMRLRKGASVQDAIKFQGLRTAWIAMRARCDYAPNSPSWKYYGGKGITYCREWMSLRRFVKDMWKGYEPGMQLDRIDGDGNYCKENCQWLSREEHCRKTGGADRQRRITKKVTAELEAFLRN